MTNRIFRFDNARFLLMFLVIFGHLLECIPGSADSTMADSAIYRAIYLFHIPALVFVSGYFASFHPKKIVLRLILPYVVFQTLYLVFNAVVLNHSASVSLSYTTPYWLLWYLFAMAVYHLLIPFFDTEKVQSQIMVWTIAVLLSLLAGYDSSIGYFLSLSRIMTFAPFFLTGYYLKKDRALFQNVDAHFLKRVSMIGVAVAVVGMICTWRFQLSSQVLYGSYSYADAGYSPIQKFLVLMIGYGGIACMRLIPDREIPVVSRLGRNTLPIYCLHGFAVSILKRMHIFTSSEAVNLVIAALCAIGLMILFGNKWVAGLFSFPKKWER